MIKFLVMDVDGTLTDGKIYMGDDGELFKSFDIKDGCGIKDILPQYGIIPIIITARESKILKNRCEELNIKDVYQGVCKKLDKLNDIIENYNIKMGKGYTLKDCAYIGDDIPDLQCMQFVKEAGGIIGCPNDAAKIVKEISDYITKKKGGNGAVREFIDWLIS
ncbi:MAG: KdsC family phosphatase [Suilimivivens sp.]